MIVELSFLVISGSMTWFPLCMAQNEEAGHCFFGWTLCFESETMLPLGFILQNIQNSLSSSLADIGFILTLFELMISRIMESNVLEKACPKTECGEHRLCTVWLPYVKICRARQP